MADPSPSPAKVPSKKKKIFPGLLETKLPVFAFNEQSSSWVPHKSDASATHSPKSLKIVSWNILFDFHQQEVIFTSARRPLIVKTLEQTDADIIGLQEVTADLVELFTTSPFIKATYLLSDIDGSSFTQYGQLIMVRKTLLSCTLSILHFSSMKRAVIAHLPLTSHELVVPCLHLTSDRASSDFVAGRKKQMEMLHSVLDQLPPPAASAPRSIMILGDMNFGDGPENAIIPSTYVDVWRSLKAEDPGFTYDPPNNTMARATTVRGIPRRLDRILLNSAHLRPVSIGLIGNAASDHQIDQNQWNLIEDRKAFLVANPDKAVKPDNGFEGLWLRLADLHQGATIQIFPSDHFGLSSIITVSPS